MWGLCLLFFVFMAGVTVYAVHRDHDRLPRVELALAREEGGGRYTVPLSAVRTDGEGRTFLFLILEEAGPWGKEYTCKRAFLKPIRRDPAAGTALVAGQGLSRYPIAGAGEGPLADGQRVRFYLGGAP